MAEEDVVQPNEGQGDGITDAPYAEYLNRLPEEVRGDVEPIFKEWDGNVTKRFQDGAEFRKTWEPYQDLGVHNLNPEEVKWLIDFREAALNNPQAVREWFEKDYAPNNGIDLTPAQQEAIQQQEDEFGFVDPNAQLEQLLKSQLGPIQQQVEQFSQWQQQQEQAARMQEAERMVQSQISELKDKHGSEFNEEAVEKLLVQYIETDPQHAVQRAFEDWRAIRSQIERDTLQSKVNQPPPAEGGGVADGAPEPIKWADASRIALEQLRQANSA